MNLTNRHEVMITDQNGVEEQFLDCDSSLSCHKGNLFPDSEEEVLFGDLLEQSVIIYQPQFVHFTLGHMLFPRNLSDLFQLFVVHKVKVGFGCVPQSINGSQMVDQKLDENKHLFLVLDYQVDASLLQLYTDTLPTVERKLVQQLYVQEVNMLSHHPKP